MSSRPGGFTFTQVGPYQLYSTMELLRLPPPEWLIDGVLPLGELSVLYAPPESFKSFLALDLALSVASGKAWQGREVTTPGFVIYIAAEGSTGIAKRVTAWVSHHGVDPEEIDVAWLIESLAVTSDSEALLQLLERIEEEVRRVPVLIVIDTLARCFDGEESETGDMSRFVAGCDVLRHKYGCSVLVIHHTRMDGQRERGNTALRAGARMMIGLTRDNGFATVKCEKMNDAEHFDDVNMEFQRVYIGVDDKGREQYSGVLSQSTVEQLRLSQKDIMVDIMRTGGPMTWEQWKQQVVSAGIDVESFHKLSGTVRAGFTKDATVDPPVWAIKE